MIFVLYIRRPYRHLADYIRHTSESFNVEKTIIINKRCRYYESLGDLSVQPVESMAAVRCNGKSTITGTANQPGHKYPG
jgi:hypothetical protein